MLTVKTRSLFLTDNSTVSPFFTISRCAFKIPPINKFSSTRKMRIRVNDNIAASLASVEVRPVMSWHRGEAVGASWCVPVRVIYQLLKVLKQPSTALLMSGAFFFRRRVAVLLLLVDVFVIPVQAESERLPLTVVEKMARREVPLRLLEILDPTAGTKIVRHR
jgi:hypothetical protein